MLPQPIWDVYKNNYKKFGNPNADAYVAQIGDRETGLRMDFQNASLFWNWHLVEPVVWDVDHAPWRSNFCAGKENFSCNPVRRRDPYVDFTISDSNNSGPLIGTEGFSTLIEASLAENLVSKISLEYELQGNVRFYVEGSYQGDWIRSEDSITQGVTIPKWHIGGNTITIRFWQSPGKHAHLKLEKHEKGIGIPEALAFESQGTLVSSTFQPPTPEYIDFEPPPYPADPGAPEVPSESQSGEPAETEPGIPGIEFPNINFPDISKWWNDLVKSIQDKADQWWQDFTKDLEKRAEQELLKRLQEAVDSLARQCSGNAVLVLAVSTGVILRKRYRRQNTGDQDSIHIK
jgi:hypothetical protein